MKKFIIYLFSFLIIGINTSFADISLTKAPSLIKSTSDSLEISWEKLDSASGYFIYYSETSGKNYESFGDVVEENKTTITGLKENTTYYVTVLALDKVTMEEGKASPEGIFNTKSETENDSKFAIDKVIAKQSTELELTFNKEIEQQSDAIREFKITKDNKEVTKVKETKLVENDKTKLTVILSNPITSGEYKIVVINITDKDGNNIEEGINGELSFIVSDFTKTDINNNTEVQVSPEEKEVELNAGSPEDENANQYYGLAGKNITGVLSTGEMVAGEAKKLPQTGPESIFMLFISLILGSLFYFRKRKIV